MALSKVVNINEIDVKNIDQTLKLQALKLWTLKSKKNPNDTYSLEILFVDEEGTIIQANVLKSLFYRFEHLLNEGSSYVISSPSIFNLHENTFRFSPLSIKLMLRQNTTISVCGDFKTPGYALSFVEFESILSGAVPQNRSVDVIGTVVSRGSLICDAKDVQKHRIYLQVENVEGVQMQMTLWSKYAYRVNDFLENHTNDSPVVIVLQFGAINTYGGAISVQSYFDVSKLFLNNEMEPINEFKQRYVPRRRATSSAITLLPSRAVSETDDFLKLHPVKTLSAILVPSQVEKVIVLGNVYGIRQDKPWFYIGCMDCFAKGQENWVSKERPDGSIDRVSVYECVKVECPKMKKTFGPCFTIPLRVNDTNSKATLELTLFNRDAKKLLGRSAKEYVDMHVRAGHSLELFPDEFNVLKGRLFAFKISITSYNLKNNSNEYSVSCLTEDAQIIAQLQAKIEKPISMDSGHCRMLECESSFSKEPISQTSDNIPLSPTESTKDTVSNLVVITPEEKKRKHDDVVDIEDDTGASSTKPKHTVEGHEVVTEMLVPKLEK